MLVFEKLKIKDIIREGPYANVYKGRDTSMQLDVFAKVSYPNEVSRKALEKEANLLSQLDHPHICKMFRLIKSPQSFAMTTEYTALSLRDYLNKNNILTEEGLLSVCKQTLLGLQYLLEKKVNCIEVRPENILLFKMDEQNGFPYAVKLANMYQSNQDASQSPDQQLYSAPELVVKGFKKLTDRPSSVYSLGITLFECLTGQLPYGRGKQNYKQFCTDNIEEINQAIFGDVGSKELRELLSSMISVKVENRKAIEMLLENEILLKVSDKELYEPEDTDFDDLTNPQLFPDRMTIAKILLELIRLSISKRYQMLDLRPKNVLFNLQTRIIKLADDTPVDQENIQQDNELLSMYPVELLRKQPVSQEFKAIYPVMCLGFYMLSGQLPFLGKDPVETIQFMTAKKLSTNVVETEENVYFLDILLEFLNGKIMGSYPLMEVLQNIEYGYQFNHRLPRSSFIREDKFQTLCQQLETTNALVQKIQTEYAQNQSRLQESYQLALKEIETLKQSTLTSTSQAQENVKNLQQQNQTLQKEVAEATSRIVSLQEIINNQQKTIGQVQRESQYVSSQLKNAQLAPVQCISGQTNGLYLAALSAACLCSKKSLNLLQAAQNGCLKCCATFIDQMGNDYGKKSAIVYAVLNKHRDCYNFLETYQEQRETLSYFTNLMLAAALGKTEQLKTYLDQHGQQIEGGVTALMLAVEWGNIDCIQLLLETESKITDAFGRTAMHRAYEAGQSELIEVLADKLKGSLNNQGRTVLMEAAIRGDATIVGLLSSKECKIVDKTGKTALIYAGLNDKLDCFQILLKTEASTQNSDGGTALTLFASLGKLQFVELLVSQEGNMRDKADKNALHYAAFNGFEKCVDVIASVEKGKLNKNNCIVLMEAAFSGDERAVKLLLKHESQYIANDGMTALGYAAMGGHQGCVNLLAETEKGIFNKSGKTALMEAAQRGDAKAVKLLISLEAKKFDKDGRTALIYANSNGHKACVDLLFDLETKIGNGNSQTSLMLAAKRKDIKACQLLSFQEYIYVDKDNRRAIDYACDTGDIKVVEAVIPPYDKLFLAAKNSKCVCESGYYYDQDKFIKFNCLNCCAKYLERCAQNKQRISYKYLINAIECDKKETVELIMHWTAGKRLYEHEETAMIVAAKKNYRYFVQLMLPYEKGLRYNGQTALMYAVTNRAIESVRVLAPFEKGLKDSYQRTALKQLQSGYNRWQEGIDLLSQYAEEK